DPFGANMGSVGQSVSFANLNEGGDPNNWQGGCVVDGAPIACSMLNNENAQLCPKNDCGPRVVYNPQTRQNELEPLTTDPNTGELGIWKWEKRRNPPGGVDTGDTIYVGTSFWARVFQTDFVGPQKTRPPVEFLRDNDEFNRSYYGSAPEKMIFNSITALFSDDCINAFKAAGLKDPFTIVNGTGVVVGPASLSTNPSNLGYMGIPEQSRKEILENFSSYDAKAFTVRGPLTSDGRARIFLNNSALGSLDELVGYMAHEFIHVAGVKGIKP